MADKIHKLTDKRLKEIEDRLKEIYSEAQEDLRKGWDEYLKQSAIDVHEKQIAYDNALRSGNRKKIAKAKKNLEQEKIIRTLSDQRYQMMVADVTSRLANVNEIALAYVNNELPKIYTINYNAIGDEANELGIDFTFVNENVVRDLVISGDVPLPYKELNKKKDIRWNTKQLNSSLLQGILQGESMDKIAERILPIVGNNEASAIRNARTMVTSAENLGRLESYRDLTESGAIMTKIWLAAHDSRTRDSHREIDGMEIGIYEKFPNKLLYPADPSGDAAEVYNCRCSLGTNIIGFKRADGSIEYVKR